MAMIPVGWCYTDDPLLIRWHLCADKPKAAKGRVVRRVYREDTLRDDDRIKS